MIRGTLAIVFTLLYSAFGHLIYPIHRLRRRGLSQWFFWSYARILFALSGIKVEAEGLEHIDPQGRYLIVSNHQSLFDIPFLMATLPLDVKYFAKRELARVPIFGTVLILYKHVLVERQSARGAVQALKRARVSLDRWSLAIFPEGTRSTDGRVHAFKTGGLALAAEAGVSILPVAMRGTGEALPKGSISPRPGATLRLKVFPPVTLEQIGTMDRKALAKHLEDTIRSYVETDIPRRSS